MSVSKHHKTSDSKCLNTDALHDWQSAYLIESDKPVWNWISNAAKNLDLVHKKWGQPGAWPPVLLDETPLLPIAGGGKYCAGRGRGVRGSADSKC